MATIEGTLIILMSADGNEPWYPVLPDAVPDWIKNDPDVLANLVNGEMAKQADGLCWYRATKINADGETKQ
jgi:hypothetical protein